MLISCKRILRNKRITNKSEKDNATRIATTTIMLTIIYSIKYRTIVIALLSIIKLRKKISLFCYTKC